MPNKKAKERKRKRIALNKQLKDDEQLKEDQDGGS